MPKSLVAIVSISALTAIISCSQSNTSTPTQGAVKILVEQSLRPLIESEIGVFQRLYPQATVEPIYVYDADLMAYFLADSADLALTTHPLSDAAVEQIKEEKIWPQQLVIAKDGLAVVASANFPNDSLSLAALKEMLLNESNSLPYHIVFDHKGSATVRFLEEDILGGTPVSPRCYAAENETEVLHHVKVNEDAIGIIGVSYIVDKTDSGAVSFQKDLKIIALSGDTGAAYMPLQSYLYTGEYPLTRSISLYNREARAGLATGFAAFLASERGQRIILREGLVPATMPVRLVKISTEFQVKN